MGCSVFDLILHMYSMYSYTIIILNINMMMGNIMHILNTEELDNVLLLMTHICMLSYETADVKRADTADYKLKL